MKLRNFICGDCLFPTAVGPLSENRSLSGNASAIGGAGGRFHIWLLDVRDSPRVKVSVVDVILWSGPTTRRGLGSLH